MSSLPSTHSNRGEAASHPAFSISAKSPDSNAPNSKAFHTLFYSAVGFTSVCLMNVYKS